MASGGLCWGGLGGCCSCSAPARVPTSPWLGGSEGGVNQGKPSLMSLDTGLSMGKAGVLLLLLLATVTSGTEGWGR